MARVIINDVKRPYILEIGADRKAICGCGLSNTLPLCDGSHKKTLDEQPDKCYRYSGGVRTEIPKP